MLDVLYRVVTNALYLVPLRVSRLKAEEPDIQVLAAGATKARKMGEETDVKYEPGWVVARRGVLILTGDKLICGPWKIPLATITGATLLRVIGPFFAKGLVLKVSTAGGSHYQFGLQYDPAWESQTALKLTVEDSKIKYSVFSILVRIVAVALLTWLVIQWLSQLLN
jgi:hypothetical protein